MVEKIGVIGGSIILKTDLLKNSKKKIISTKYGESYVYLGKNFVFIQRHGPQRNLLPHLINYKANISALKKLKIINVIGIGSVGSLSKSIKPGSIVVPHDYIDLFNHNTFFNEKLNDLNKAYTFPCFNEKLRQSLIKKLKKINIKSVNRAVYFSTRGPRWETKSEINMFSKFGDLVGMTIAREAVLAQEIGINFAALCSVDNYCLGISKAQLTHDKWEKTKEKNYQEILKIFKEIIR